MKTPLCKCGCGKEVKWSKYKKDWNDYIQWHHAKGKRLSKETKKKISEVQKEKSYFKTYNKTEEHRQKVIRSNKNRTVSEETKKKISDSLKGHKRSKESRIKQSITIIDKDTRGERNSYWKGGTSEYGSEGFGALSKEIKKRDKYTCQKCKEKPPKNKIHVHHKNRVKKDNSPLNLITLCRSCHTKLHPKGFILTKIQKIACEDFIKVAL